AGDYTFKAIYSGDSNYTGSTSALEHLHVDKGTLTLVTTIHDSVTNGTPTGVLGESVYDTYVLSGTQPFAFAGTAHYTFQTGSGTPAAAGSGSQSNTQGPLAAGSYNFAASSSGDNNYTIIASGNEPLTINKGTLTVSTAVHNAADNSLIPLNSHQPLG